MRISPFVLLGAVVLIATSGRLAGAQSSAESEVAAAVAELTRGDVIRVAQSGATQSGRFRRVAGDTLFFGTQPLMAVRFNAIDTLWRRTGGAGRGMQIGAVTGGVIVGGLLLLISRGDGDTDVGAGGLLFGTVTGATIGGFAGWIVGAPFQWWSRLHPQAR